MVKELRNTRLRDIMPANITAIAEARNAAAAIDEQNARTVDDTARLAIIAGIDTLPESIIDLLAWQWRVDFYDAEADLSVKRKQVKTSIAMHRIKGTKRAVVMALRMVYDSGSVEEWFTYGGQPYRFRVHGIRGPARIEELKKLRRLIDVTKNARSWMEGIGFRRDIGAHVYIGSVVGVNRSYEISPPRPKHAELRANVHIGGTTSTARAYSIIARRTSPGEIRQTVYIGSAVGVNRSYEIAPRRADKGDVRQEVHVIGMVRVNREVHIHG